MKKRRNNNQNGAAKTGAESQKNADTNKIEKEDLGKLSEESAPGNIDAASKTKEMEKVDVQDGAQAAAEPAAPKKFADQEAMEASAHALFETISDYKAELTNDDYLERIIYIHLKTKELYVLAEEYDQDLRAFVQPINDLKNAYEHVLHVCANEFMDRNGMGKLNKAYIRDNLKSALRYESKAFFDTAEYLSMILRRSINERLDGFTYNQISSIWDDYEEVRTSIIDANRRFAEIRKDRSKASDYDIDMNIDEYYSDVKKLLQRYIFIEEKVYPKLEQEYGV